MTSNFQKEIFFNIFKKKNKHKFTESGLYYYYCKDVLKARWKAKEYKILIDAEVSILYAGEVVGGRWIEFEQHLENSYNLYSAESTKYSIKYIHAIIGNTWPDEYPTEGFIYDIWYKINMIKIFGEGVY